MPEPWFVAKDVCAVLSLEVATSQHTAALDADERFVLPRRSHVLNTKAIDGLFGQFDPKITLVNESGLYSLILKSRKPEATHIYGTNNIRVVTLDGTPWFAAADVRAVLGIQRGGTAFDHLDADETQTIRKCGSTPLKGHGLNIISESGLYKLIMRSDKPEAKGFQDWVTRIAQRYCFVLICVHLARC